MPSVSVNGVRLSGTYLVMKFSRDGSWVPFPLVLPPTRAGMLTKGCSGRTPLVRRRTTSYFSCVTVGSLFSVGISASAAVLPFSGITRAECLVSSDFGSTNVPVHVYVMVSLKVGSVFVAMAASPFTRTGLPGSMIFA